MGANDDREMLEAAKEEVGRLESEVATLKWLHAKLLQANFNLLNEHDAALAVIARVRAECEPIEKETTDRKPGSGKLYAGWVMQLLAQSPTDALAEHDRAVKAEALEEAAKATRPNYRAQMLTGVDSTGTLAAHDTLHRAADRIDKLAAEYRKAGS